MTKSLKEQLMALDGVSGVSESAGEVVVYLASEEARPAAQALADAAGVRVKIVVTGPFSPRS